MKLGYFLVGFSLLAGCVSSPKKDSSQHILSSYKSISSSCYNRSTQPYTAIVDTHLHFRPFGGSALKFEEVIDYLKKSGVFVCKYLWDWAKATSFFTLYILFRLSRNSC